MGRLQANFGVVILLLVSGQVGAALFDRGGGLIYDSDQDVTWLQDARYAVTSGFEFSTTDSPVTGYMTWDHSIDWVSNLIYYDSVRDTTWSDWRLPMINNPEIGNADCLSGSSSVYCSFGNNTIDPNTGELAYLFYTILGNVANSGISNTGPFLNMLVGDYWYGDLFSSSFPGSNDSAWDFSTSNGAQGATSLIGGVHYAWAVRDGDVLSPIPIPAPFWLFGTALIGLVGFSRRRKAA